MTPEQLKNSILQLAIQGKLVGQRKEEGTGEELFKEIQEEKKKLLEEGKIKKQKALPEISEDEIPFDIPDNWKWVKCGDILNIVSAKRVRQSDWQNKGIPFYRAREISKLSKFGTIDNDLFISEELFNSLSVYGLPEKNDLMVTAVGTLGKTYIVKENDRFYYKDASVLCFKNYAKINAMFLKYAMESSLMKNQIEANSRGTTVGTLTIVRVSNYIIPLPPLAEQKRIVEKIEELLPLVEKYEKAWTKLEELNKKFPLDMKKSILEEAIKGKLVEQRKEEGIVEDLFKEIQKEKKKLLEEGKIKKQKALPEISEDEIPFDIPDNWKWVRLGEIVYNHGQKKPSSTFSYIDIGSIDNKNQRLNENENIIEAEKAPSRARKIVYMNDVLYATVRPYLHNMCIIDKEFVYPPIASTGFAVMACYNNLYNKYLFYYLLSPTFDRYANSIENSKGVAYPAINDERLYNAVVSFPPLAEQKRIVEKIEEFLPLCEKLK